MPHKVLKNPADYVVPLNMNGLEGRMLRLPAPKTKKASQREILFVYGHHSSLERWWGLMLALNHYGAVTMPDLPGFGGMDSFYKIGKKPTLDNMADYLAAFIKLRYRRKKVVICGLSFGFIVVTRMLQRYPELTKKVTLLVSLVGFAHKDDFTFSKPRRYGYILATRMLSHRLPATIFRYTALNSWVLQTFYGHTHNAKNKLGLANDKEELEMLKKVEVGLWHDNDVRTWAFTTAEFLTFDNCKAQVKLPLWHITAAKDHYFDHNIVEQHLQIIFTDVQTAEYDLGAHTPTVIADEKIASGLLPAKLRRHLSRLP